MAVSPAQSFYQFLLAAGSQVSISSDPWRDIGTDLSEDLAAPRADGALYDYLKTRLSDEELLEEAWHEYLKVRS